MRHLDFPADVLARIDVDRFNHPDPLVRRRMEVLWLKALGQPHDLIGTIASVSRATVQRLVRAYGDGGLEAVGKFNWKPRPSALAPHRFLLEAEFAVRPPHTAGEACERIAKLTGVRRGPTQVREFLHQTMGLRWRKTAAVPVPPKQSLAEHAANQADFLKDKAPAAPRRGPGRAAGGVFRGCGPLRAVHVSGLDVEPDAPVREGGLGTSALQRAGGVQRRNA